MTSLAPIFGNDRIVLLPDFQTAHNYFYGLNISNMDVPEISIKQMGSSTVTLNIKGIEDFEKIKVFTKNVQSKSCHEEVFGNSKEIPLNLSFNTPKYTIRVQGIRGQQTSEMSNELQITLPKSNKKIIQIFLSY